jgi:hypothetical protein
VLHLLYESTPPNEQLLLTAHAAVAAGSLRSPCGILYDRAAAELRALGGFVDLIEGLDPA